LAIIIIITSNLSGDDIQREIVRYVGPKVCACAQTFHTAVHKKDAT